MHKYTSSWEDSLPTVQMKLNLRIHRKHNSTPFAIYYGRMHNIFNTNAKITDTRSWEARLDHIEKLVHPALVKAVHEYHNKMRNLRSDGTKLDDLWKGPYIIDERVSMGYNLVDVDSETGGIVNLHPVPREQLHEWTRADAVIRGPNTITADFEKILSHREIDGIVQYNVLWSDGSQSEIPAADFRDKSYLNQYLMKQNRALNKQSVSRRRQVRSSHSVAQLR
eukprot:Pgem_evm1s3875